MWSVPRSCGLWLAIFALSLLFILGAIVGGLFGLIADGGLALTDWSRASMKRVRRALG